MAAQHRYAVECQSSYERGDLPVGLGNGKSLPWANGRCLSTVSRVKARTSAADEGRRAMDSDSPGRSRPFPPLSLYVLARQLASGGRPLSPPMSARAALIAKTVISPGARPPTKAAGNSLPAAFSSVGPSRQFGSLPRC